MQTVSCNLCGSTKTSLVYKTRDLLYKTTDKTFHLVRCDTCGLVYLNPRPDEKELSSFYPDTYRPYELGAHVARYTPPANPSRRAIDIGCGSGDILAEIAQKHPDWGLYGVDFDVRAVEAARSLGFMVTHGSLFEAHYDNVFFDSATMNHFLEHVPDPLATLHETHRILKTDGSLSITVPNFHSLSRMLFGTYWYHTESPRHLYHFTPKTLTRMLVQAGFENIQYTFVPSPKYFLQSLALWQSNHKKRYPKIIWQILSLPARIISILKLSSTMIVTATKRQREAQ